MRYFIWPLLLFAINGSDIEQAIMQNLNQNYPLEKAQYVCDFSHLNISNLPQSDSVAVDGFGKDNPRGQVAVRLSFFQQGKRVYQTAASIKIGVLEPVYVVARPIKSGEAITAEELTIETRDIASLDEVPVQSIDELTGMVSTRYLTPGKPLTVSSIQRPPTLKSGDHVRIRFSKGSLILDAEGIARENGSKGNRIKVMNTDTKKIISAVVVDSTMVAIGDREEP
jgi:flagella basal body P-ring formation protein FlgA